VKARRCWLPVVLCLLAPPAWSQDAATQSADAVMQPSIIGDRPLQVTLVKPTSGQTFVIGSTMPLWAEAEDIDDNIQSIWFKIDGTTVAYGGVASWVVTSGSHSVVVCASNDHVPMRMACTSAITIYTVPNQLPTITLTDPAGGETYNTGATVGFTATASDVDGTIKRIEFLVDGVEKGEDASSPYALSWYALTGNHTVQARAIDDANGVRTSAAHSITVNTAPTATLTEPDGGEAYNTGATVGFTATASDVDGTINRVEFLVDGVEKGEDTSSPYGYNWVGNTTGSHTVQARAVDAMGKTGLSAVHSFLVDTAPSVTLAEPDGGETYNTGATVGFTATASDTDGTVNRVEFLVDGTEVGQDTSSPYAYGWVASATGSHTVQARAVDNLGRTKTTATHAILVDTAPSVALTEPDGGEIYADGELVHFAATASDSDGTIASVEFLIDGAQAALDSVSPYGFTWTASTGPHTVQARATDNLGRTATTAIANVTVSSSLSGAVTRTYTYNAYQQLCRVDEPETGATLMGYDAAGNLAWSASGLPAGTACDVEGDTAAILARKATRTYDARNRVTLLAFADHESDTAYTYTPTGQLETISASNGGDGLVTTTYTYNRRDMPTREDLVIAGAIDWPVNYGYDANGHLAVQNWHGLNIDYAPNALGQATQAGDYATDVRYWPNGAIRQFTYGNGIVHTMTQNARGLPDRSIDAYGSTKILDDGYDYDQVGNVAGISDGATGQGQKGNRLTTYDGLNRLTSVTALDMFGTASYAYDVQDNLKHVQVTAGSQPRNVDYCYDAANRLTNVMSAAATYCGGATVTGLGYDAQGNLANKDGVLYAFDQGNRLRSVNGGTLGAYLYDGHGRRVRDAVGGVTKYSQYTLSGQLVMSADNRAGKVREYIALGGSLVLIRERDVPTNTYTMLYQHTDALGSPVAVTTETRALVERREYEPYGYQIAPFALEDGPGYTGHVADAATGLVYMQQRYYDPELGVFPSTDPVTPFSPGGAFNRYWYANANPFGFVDPDGRQSAKIHEGDTEEQRRAALAERERRRQQAASSPFGNSSLSNSALANQYTGKALAQRLAQYAQPSSVAQEIDNHGQEGGNENNSWQGKPRYILTRRVGWIDLRHVSVSSLMPSGHGFSIGLVWELGQRIAYPSSSFAKEDLNSNFIGTLTSVRQGIGDPRSSGQITQEIVNYLQPLTQAQAAEVLSGH
jgi:RHS repeat-associated protein